MGMFDDLKDKAKDVMDNPEHREKIEQIAHDKGISLDEAKEHFLHTEKEDQGSEQQ